jgi:hypothetical protein
MHMTQRCIDCHSRLPDVVDSPLAAQLATTPEVAALAPAERARVDVALRRFDDARLIAWGISLARVGPRLSQSGSGVRLAREWAMMARNLSDLPTARDGLVYDLAAGSVLLRWIDTREKGARGAQDLELASAYYELGVIEDRTAFSIWAPQTDAYMEAALRAAPSGPLAHRAYGASLEQHALRNVEQRPLPALDPSARGVAHPESAFSRGEPKPLRHLGSGGVSGAGGGSSARIRSASASARSRFVTSPMRLARTSSASFWSARDATSSSLRCAPAARSAKYAKPAAAFSSSSAAFAGWSFANERRARARWMSGSTMRTNCSCWRMKTRSLPKNQRFALASAADGAAGANAAAAQSAIHPTRRLTLWLMIDPPARLPLTCTTRASPPRPWAQHRQTRPRRCGSAGARDRRRSERAQGRVHASHATPFARALLGPGAARPSAAVGTPQIPQLDEARVHSPAPRVGTALAPGRRRAPHPGGAPP